MSHNYIYGFELVWFCQPYNICEQYFWLLVRNWSFGFPYLYFCFHSSHCLSGKVHISICGFDYRLKMARNKDLPFETTPFIEQRNLALIRIERGVGGPGAQLSKRTSTLVSSLRNRCLRSPQLAASLNSNRKTPVFAINRFHAFTERVPSV